ncbi:hypothetical protein HMPREF3034_01023 [Prevotella sp. DNF00663]|nr:hypothetical protein HMPREF3034_01023 [Prevotella sp. DNF00663]
MLVFPLFAWGMFRNSLGVPDWDKHVAVADKPNVFTKVIIIY